jgi:hypothetical protein
MESKHMRDFPRRLTEMNHSIGKGRTKGAPRHLEGEHRKILLVGRGGSFSASAADYAVNLAERLDYDIVALSIEKEWDFLDPVKERFLRCGRSTRPVGRTGAELLDLAEEKGLVCRFEAAQGDPARVIEKLSRAFPRIEFVVMDSEIDREAIADSVNLPVFSVVSNTSSKKGGSIMRCEPAVQKKTLTGKTMAFGALSVGLYAAVFMNSGTVMGYFTKGGWYAALPVATVLLFSFAHGAFASNLWSLLGIEAFKRDSLQPTERKVVQKRKRAQKRPRVYAYVNPFHRF